MCIQVYVCMRVEPRGQYSMSSLVSLYFFFETGSLIKLRVHDLVGLGCLQPLPELRWQACATRPDFWWVLRIQSQVIVTAWQTLFQLNHLFLFSSFLHQSSKNHLQHVGLEFATRGCLQCSSQICHLNALIPLLSPGSAWYWHPKNKKRGPADVSTDIETALLSCPLIRFILVPLEHTRLKLVTDWWANTQPLETNSWQKMWSCASLQCALTCTFMNQHTLMSVC